MIKLINRIFPGLDMFIDESLTIEGKIRFWYNWKGRRLFKDF